MVSSAVEVLVDCDKECHDALGVRDLHGDHVVNVKHARNTSIPNGDIMGGRGVEIGHMITGSINNITACI